jgi:hypothetical protein
MPLRTYRLGSLIARLVLLSLAAVCLAALRPAGRSGAQVEKTTTRRRRRSGVRRIAVSLSFATLFFAGAAFSAGAGDLMVQLVEEQATTAASSEAAGEATEDAGCEQLRRSDWDAEDCPADEAASDAAAPAEGAPADEPAAAEPPAEEAPAGPTETASPDTASAATTQALAEATGSVAEAHSDRGRAHESSRSGELHSAVRQQATRRRATDGAPPVLAPRRSLSRHAATLDPEADLPGTAATIWLHRALPDPTPPSKRLTRAFSRNLRFASNRHRVDWALVLGVLRARGERGSVPAGRARLDRLARRLSQLGARRDQWTAVLALEGRTAFADRTIALARYHRAVGLRALIRGLEAAKPRLTKRLLADERVSIYAGGRHDLAIGRIDVRVIVLIRYLAEAHGQVTISSLKTGHGIYSRPGVVSAHTYGQAVDIAALAGKSITGNQEPGGLTEQAVRDILLLPAELRPTQVISLLGLGGPSFPMANHHDHIHAGF